MTTPLKNLVARAERQAKPVVRWGIAHALPRIAWRVSARRGDMQSRLVFDADRLPTSAMNDLFDEIRGSGPVHKAEFVYMTARHSIVKEVLTSNDFRSGIGAANATLLGRLYQWSIPDVLHPVAPPSLLVTEPPDHTRYRKLVTRVFTVRAVAKLRDRTEQIAKELLDNIDPNGPVDLIESYCSLLPVTVIAEILGVPTEQRLRLLKLGAGAAPSLDAGLPWRTFRTVENALREFDTWLSDHLDYLRANPGDNLMSQLITAREDGVGLTDLELKATAGLVLAAGFETTVNLLGNGITQLHENPDQLAVLRDDPAKWANAADEVLRVDPPVLMTGRTCLRDTVVAGMPVPRGAVMVAILAAANRDPELFDNPTRFDVSRENAREHVSFSAGRHYCLGAALARVEGEVGLRALFDRYPKLRLTHGATRRTTRILRGYERLPAKLNP